jgi:hypothetical protein
MTRPTAPATRQRGPLPRTLRKPTAKRSAAVKGSPTRPREARAAKRCLFTSARSEATPHHTRPHSPTHWVRNAAALSKAQIHRNTHSFRRETLHVQGTLAMKPNGKPANNPLRFS